MKKDTDDRRDRHQPHRLYFSRQTEKKVFFYLTMGMLLAGLLVRLI